jgi:hypothetical protein
MAVRAAGVHELAQARASRGPWAPFEIQKLGQRVGPLIAPGQLRHWKANTMQMQQIQQERRASGVRRVKFDTLVEVVGQELHTPAFEGRAVDLSGRGMHIAAAFVPECKTPLVLRFEHDGREVVVEGVVAWRKEGSPEGAFGLRFTALDSKSVVVLKELCARDAGSERPAQTSKKAAVESLFEELEESETPQPVVTTTVGAPLKLHLQGLAAPMKARVVDGRHSRLRVGSQLEFLTLGRELMVEDLTGGAQKAAHVHSVNVEVNPDTQVPQLIVTVRWDGASDVTPEPTVVSSKRRGAIDPDDLFGEDEATSPGRKVRSAPKPKLTTRSPSPERDHDDHDDFDDEDDDLNTAEALLKGRVALWAVGASRRMKSASEQVAHASRSVAGVVSSLLSRPPAKPGAERRVPTQRGTRSMRPATTSVPAKGRVHAARGAMPNNGRSTSGTRNQSAARDQNQPRRNRLALLGLAAATLCVGMLVFRSKDEKPATLGPVANGVAVNGSTPNATLGNGLVGSGLVAQTPTTLPGVAAPGAAPVGAVGALAQPGIAVQANGMNAAVLPRQPLNTEEQLRPDTFGMVANVPLFGPTQMATTEPTPDGEERVAQVAPRRSGVDEVSLAKDESFSDKPVTPAQAAAAQANKAFQVGRLSEPVVHRLRLDAPAESLSGEKTANGFSVLVPGRKVMENGAGIVNADARVSQVNVKNSPAGAKVTFRFGKEVSGYKARLRNDYLEFFLNP